MNAVLLFVKQSKSWDITMKFPQRERGILKVDVSGQRANAASQPNLSTIQ